MDIQKVWNYTICFKYRNNTPTLIRILIYFESTDFLLKFSYAVRYKYCTKDVLIQVSNNLLQ